MKPVYLEFSGINSFSETARIDFRALLSGGVFGIFGDTGSGKSTILDSIHFALYGEIDRVPKSFNDCINHRSESAKVLFDFEILNGGERKIYRVQRERKRKTGSSKAYLYEFTGENKMLALVEGVKEVNEKLEEIIGLSFADFKMCIALPQGDFAALVQSTPSDRVKLVARLFNLEKYGEALSKAVNERFYRAQEEVNLLKAKMDESADCSDETMAQLQAQIQEQQALLTQSNQALRAAETQVKQLEEIRLKKQAFESVQTEIQTMQTRFAEMQRKQRMLHIAPKAQAVQEKYTAMQTAEKLETQAVLKAKAEQENYQACQGKIEQATKALQESNFDETLLQWKVQLQKVRDAVVDMQNAKLAKDKLDDCILAYRALENACKADDFDGKLNHLQAKLAELGEDETFFEFLKTHCKDALLVDTYQEVQTDLRALAGKYPQTQAEVDILLGKYTLQSVAQTPDMQRLSEAFKKQEEQRKLLKKQISDLENRRLQYQENESKKKLLAEQGKLLRSAFELAQEKIASLQGLGSEEQIEKQIKSCEQAKKQAESHLNAWKDEQNKAYAEMQKQQGLQALHAQTKQEQETALRQAMQAGGFAQVEDATALLNELGDLQKAQEQTQAFLATYEQLQTQIKQTDTTAFASYNEQAYLDAQAVVERQKSAVETVNQTLGGLKNEYESLCKQREKYQGWLKELAEKQQRQQVCDKLRLLVRGNKFLEFIASEYLQEISFTASKTLLSLTGGRYFLKYDKEFKVGDNLDGGNLRAVKTLSGGETFLVSLSLALSLSATVCLKSLRPIEFFFLDEGFGTLDGKLVDTVMDVLGKLSKTFAVGLISHVEELKHRIENKIVVTGATETHGSQVKVECY